MSKKGGRLEETWQPYYLEDVCPLEAKIPNIAYFAAA